MRTAIIVIAASAMVAFFVAQGMSMPGVALALKPVPVLALALHQRGAAHGSQGGLIALGLVLSGLGDVLLGLPGDLFLPGLISLLAAHLAYTLAFVLRGSDLAPGRALLMMAAGSVAFVSLRPDLGALALPVAAYVSVICTMGWRALALFGQIPRLAALLAAGGAISFLASDSLLAVDRFRQPVSGASLLIMATYWVAQIGIALSTAPDAQVPEAAAAAA